MKTSELQGVLNYLVGRVKAENQAVTGHCVQQRTPILPIAHLFLGLN
jgi:hypothetical protein